MNLSIRRLMSHDSISELTALLHAAYAQLAALGLNYTAVDQSEDVTRARASKGECYLAFDGEHMVGTILFRKAADEDGCAYYERPEVSGLHQFGVLPSHQRSGIGSRLIQMVEKRALETGALEIALDTAQPATHLVRWYERIGYGVVDEVQWDGKTYRSFIMSKKLTQVRR